MKTFLVSASIVLLSLTSLHARTRHIPLESLSKEADYVAIVKVVDKEAIWDDRGVMINTHYTMEVEETILGKPGPVIFIKCPGGVTALGEAILVSDVPQFDPNKTYLIFGSTDEKSFPLVGHEQGVFRILKDKADGKQYIVDYFGNLIEEQGGKIIRGRLVDPSVKDRLAFVEPRPSKRAAEPKPVFRDASGKVIPAGVDKIPAKKKEASGNRPLEKSAFINYIVKSGGK
ncbi:MAG: hypothetical protein P8123_04345 [bacterium]|jgi:hypothetical protein